MSSSNADAVREGNQQSGGAPSSLPSDTSPHQTGTISAGGVRIHYLDWGGRGPALVFIPGAGNTAHVFDDFAPRFRDSFRVVGITRVGFGESDQPNEGYDLASRVMHISTVLDTLGISRAVLVGHSLGGDEITAFASAYADRTVGLVYIDAAYDHVQASKWEQALEPFFAAAPTPTAQDFASATNLQAFLASVRGVVFPIGEVLAITNFDSSGVARGQRTPARISQLLTSAAQPLDYSRVRAPALSLYSEWESAADVLPFLGRDPAATARATAALQPVRAAQEVERARFAHEVKGGRVVILHAHHYQFLSHPQELERQMRDFLKSAQVSVRTARLSSSEG